MALEGWRIDPADSPAAAIVSRLRRLADSVADAPVLDERLQAFLGHDADPGPTDPDDRVDPPTDHAPVAGGSRQSPRNYMEISPRDFAEADHGETRAGDGEPIDARPPEAPEPAVASDVAQDATAAPACSSDPPSSPDPHPDNKPDPDTRPASGRGAEMVPQVDASSLDDHPVGDSGPDQPIEIGAGQHDPTTIDHPVGDSGPDQPIEIGAGQHDATTIDHPVGDSGPDQPIEIGAGQHDATMIDPTAGAGADGPGPWFGPEAPLGADGHLAPTEPVPLSALPPLGSWDDEEALAEWNRRLAAEDSDPGRNGRDGGAEMPDLAAHPDDEHGVAADGLGGDDAEPPTLVPIADTLDADDRPLLRPVLTIVGTAVAVVGLLMGGFWWGGGASLAPVDSEVDSAGSGASSATAEVPVSDTTAPEAIEIERPDSEPSRASTAGFEDRSAEDAPDDRTTAGSGREGTVPAAPTTTAPPSSGSGAETTADSTAPTTGATAAPRRERTTTTAVTTTEQPTTEAAWGTVLLGNRATVRATGRGVPGVLINLYRDDDGDGEAGDVIASTLTDGGGWYSFSVPGGCFVLEFIAAAGYELVPGDERLVTCLSGPGVNNALDVRLDAVLPSQVQPIVRCLIDPDHSEAGTVSVRDAVYQPVDYYLFHDTEGERIIARTDELGLPNHVLDFPEVGEHVLQWHGRDYGRPWFDAEDVGGVSAVRDGFESDVVTCDGADG